MTNLLDKTCEEVDKAKNDKRWILVENVEYSNTKYDKNTENLLIQGDNLHVLAALEKEYAKKVKCIYIDPPYNTGGVFKHYDDKQAHAAWIKFMQDRLALLRNFLSEDGVLFISIGDEELHYLKILCDEIFGRKNYCGTFVWEKKKKPSFLSKMGTVVEYVLSYAKNKSRAPAFVYGTTSKNKKYPLNNAGNGLRVIKFPANAVRFNLQDQVVNAQDMSEGNIITRLLRDLIIRNGYNASELILEGEWRYSQDTIDELVERGEAFYIAKIPFRPNHIKLGGARKKMKNLLSVAHYGISTNEDATRESEQLFGHDNSFDNPKPEQLIQLLIGSVTKKNDLVLDAFLGSGTTAAVAHKTNRRWIGIERGSHAYTHCKTRIDKLIEGKDEGGITRTTEWAGGGGYRFYELHCGLSS